MQNASATESAKPTQQTRESAIRALGHTGEMDRRARNSDPKRSARPRRRKAAILILLGVTLTGCGASPPRHGNLEYDAARAEWRMGDQPSVINADVGGYLLAAASDLERGKSVDVRATTEKGRAEYDKAIAELRSFVSLPDTNLTPAQQAEATSDATALDAFFNTPGLYANSA